MGARKGQNNFRAHQNKATQTTLEKIRVTLCCLRKGIAFRDYFEFRRYVAEKVRLYPTTLERNSNYRNLLLDHLAKAPGTLLGQHSEVNSSSQRRAQEICQELERANLKAEIQRLKRFIERRSAEHPNEEEQKVSTRTEIQDVNYQRAFEDTATVLARLLEHLSLNELGIVLDLDCSEIRNLAEIGERGLIAGPPRTKPFFDWMSRHSARIAVG
jgi:hypothetical protein